MALEDDSVVLITTDLNCASVLLPIRLRNADKWADPFKQEFGESLEK